MFIYKDKLESEGFSNTRSLAIAMAVKDLHSAICLLDNRNLNLFWSKTIEERLKEYAESEELNLECLKK